MVAVADSAVSDEDVKEMERSACLDLRLVLGHVDRQFDELPDRGAGLLSLPGTADTVATHADRRQLFVEAGHLIVDLARRWYEEDDASASPPTIANFQAFENAMTLDIAMGGLTNTVLHLLAAAHEGEIDFTIGRHRPAVAARAGAGGARSRPRWPTVHVEDVHRAGGVMATLGELDRAALINREVSMVHAEVLSSMPSPRNDIKRSASNATREFFAAAPGGVPTQVAFSQASRYESLDEDRAGGVIRDSRACVLTGRRPRGAQRQSRCGMVAS